MDEQKKVLVIGDGGIDSAAVAEKLRGLSQDVSVVDEKTFSPTGRIMHRQPAATIVSGHRRMAYLAALGVAAKHAAVPVGNGGNDAAIRKQLREAEQRRLARLGMCGETVRGTGPKRPPELSPRQAKKLEKAQRRAAKEKENADSQTA